MKNPIATKNKKKKLTAKFSIVVSLNNTHSILKHLADCLEVDSFMLSFNENDNPRIRASVASNDGKLVSELNLHNVVHKNGKLTAVVRDIALWRLSSVFYDASPVVFKPHCIFSLENFARSLGIFDRLPEVEAVFCSEIIYAMSYYLDIDPMWRIWNGMKWIEIDPWKFAVEVDIYAK